MGPLSTHAKKHLDTLLNSGRFGFQQFCAKVGVGGQKHLEVEGRAGHGKDMPEVGEQGGG